MSIDVNTSDKYTYITACEDGELVGRCIIEIIDDETANVVQVMTSPKHTHKGIATMLLRTAIEKFSQYDLTLLARPMPRDGEYDKFKTVNGLIEFYKKLGFQRTSDPCLATMLRRREQVLKKGI